MKYQVRIGEKAFEVEVRDSAGETVVSVDGREMELAIEEAGPATYTLLVDGQPLDLAAIPRTSGYGIALRGVEFEVELDGQGQWRLNGQSYSKAPPEGTIAIRAPMPGLVKRIDVNAKDEVQSGQRLLVLEAMKMENDLTAPRPASVDKVLVSTGDKVEQGQLLMVLE